MRARAHAPPARSQAATVSIFKRRAAAAFLSIAAGPPHSGAARSRYSSRTCDVRPSVDTTRSRLLDDGGLFAERSEARAFPPPIVFARVTRRDFIFRVYAIFVVRERSGHVSSAVVRSVYVWLMCVAQCFRGLQRFFWWMNSGVHRICQWVGEVKYKTLTSKTLDLSLVDH